MLARRGGFTLIEVTLAVVIGIVLVTGATLLYQQAKAGAGNTRAKAKVAALQAEVEEIVANAGGTYPTSRSVYAAWVQRRPDDFAASPWGGAASSSSDPGAAVNQPGFTGYDNLSSPVNPGPGPGSPPGAVQYKMISGSATSSVTDLSINGPVVVRYYYVHVDTPDTWWPWFIYTSK